MIQRESSCSAPGAGRQVPTPPNFTRPGALPRIASPHGAESHASPPAAHPPGSNKAVARYVTIAAWPGLTVDRRRGTPIAARQHRNPLVTRLDLRSQLRISMRTHPDQATSWPPPAPKLPHTQASPGTGKGTMSPYDDRGWINLLKWRLKTTNNVTREKHDQRL